MTIVTIPVSPRIRLALMINTDKEYMAGLKYVVTINLAIGVHYDSDMQLGGGITLNY